MQGEKIMGKFENQLAAGIYSEVASEDSDTMKLVGSSIINRMNSNRDSEFGVNLPEVMQKGYYGVRENTDLYQQAVTGKFPDKLSENKYKQALAIASGLLRGTIEPNKGEFYFTEKEIQKMKKRGKKAFDFDQVKDLGQVGKYRVFGY